MTTKRQAIFTNNQSNKFLMICLWTYYYTCSSLINFCFDLLRSKYYASIFIFSYSGFWKLSYRGKQENKRKNEMQIQKNNYPIPGLHKGCPGDQLVISEHSQIMLLKERKKEQKKDRKTRPSYLLFTVSPGTGTVDGRLRLYDSGAINVVVQSWPSVGGSGQEQPQLSPSNEGQVHDVIDCPFYMGKNLLQISVRGQT